MVSSLSAQESAGSDHESARELYGSGRDALLREEYYRAVELFKKAIDVNPSYVDPLAGLAESFLALNEFDEALRYVTQARELAGTRVDLRLLEGRIRVAMGDVAGARDLYRGVLEQQPYNLKARIGLAELAVAEGATESALQQYRQAVRLAPRNRTALSSLALLYEAQGDTEAAKRYIELALQHHGGEAMVQRLAAEHFLAAGNYARAEQHIRTALSLDSDSPRLKLLLARLYLNQELYDEARTAVEEVLSADRENPTAWYLRGLTLAHLEQPEESTRSFRMALRQEPSDEVARVVFEELMMERLGVEAEVRGELARYHFERAAELERRNLFDLAIQEYRRGLQLAPFSREGRMGYAELLRLRGFEAKYLQELEVLAANGHDDEEITDRIETYRSLLQDSIASRWGVDQFTLERHRARIAFFYRPNEAGLSHQAAAPALASYAASSLLQHEKIAVSEDTPAAVDSYAEAYRSARERSADFFLIVNISEEGRAYRIAATLYSGRGGTELREFASVRVGNGRIRDANDAVADEISAALPLRGRLVDRDGNEALIDLGRVHGVEREDSFSVVPDDELILASDEIGYMFSEADAVAEFQVTGVDDLVAEGELSETGLFDLANRGDAVVRSGAGAAGEPRPADMFPPIYRRIRDIR